MITVEEALRIVVRELPDPVGERVCLGEALGRRLAADLVANRDNPAIHVSAMDGFAMAADAGRRSWSVQGVAAAGEPQADLIDPEKCVEIMTGAPLPRGADAVVPVEEILRQDGKVALLREGRVEKGRHVRYQGSNYGKESVLLSAGESITSAKVAVLAAEGVTRVPVVRRLTVAILSSGSELISPEESPEPHQIRASNLPALKAELMSAGFSVVAEENSPDDYDALLRTIRSLAEQAEILLMTGGVSRGKYDLVEPLLAELEAEKLFHWVAQKPGKPLLGARLERPGASTLLLGLPGNPQAALIAARRYLVEAAMARHNPRRRSFRIPLSEPIHYPARKTLFQPALLEQAPRGVEARPVETTGSGDYFGLSKADGFLELAADEDYFAAGESVPFFGWSGGALYMDGTRRRRK